jgi:photosystem II stability/assembly factor-like uncharacterized protein
MKFLLPVRRGCLRHAATAVLLAVMGMAALAHAEPPPFKVAWTRGTCLHCQMARGFGDMVFANGKNLWALGRAAPGEMGSDTGMVLRSRDGGRHWRELGWTTTYPDYPLVSFANVHEGWIVAPAPYDGSAVKSLRFTKDGSTWWRLPQHEFFFSLSAIQYFGQGQGVAVGSGVFYQTSDGGQHWRKQRLLGGGLWINQMRFINWRQGYIAGCLDHRLVTLATSDDGHSWFKTELPVLTPSGRLDCALEVDGLLTVGDHEAWLLGAKHEFGPHDTQSEARVWRTADGGHTWSETYRHHWTIADFDAPAPAHEQTDTPAPMPAVAFSGPFALGPKLILLFKDTGDGKGEALYTTDRGQHWSSVPLPHDIADCVPARSGLMCTEATYPGFRLATLTLRK